MKRIVLVAGAALLGLGGAQAVADPPDLVRVVSDPVVISASTTGSATATCPAGRLAVGGGHVITGTGTAALISSSGPTTDLAAWTVEITQSPGLTLRAIAVCLAVAAPGAGATGATGATGAAGLAGPAGATGQTGQAGAAGAQGPKGDRGPRGRQASSGASSQTYTKPRCLQLRARRALPWVCRTRFKISPLADVR